MSSAFTSSIPSIACNSSVDWQAELTPDTVRRSVKFVQQIGKLPVVVKDAPGFLVNRILMPYLIEAGHLFENGARVEDIDECMLEFGMPMGPLRFDR